MFVASAAAASLRADTRLLLPSDKPDEFNFRLMWYNPVPPSIRIHIVFKSRDSSISPASFSVADLRRLPHESQNTRMKCVQCWSARAEWGGFRFGHLLEAVKPRKNAKAVRLDCADKWYEYFTIEDLLSPRVLFAMDMQGQPLAERHGAPLRHHRSAPLRI